MKKLELKHLVGYLPYGLQIQMSPNTIAELTVGETDNDKISLDSIFHFSKARPRLRPLSDLTREEYWNLSSENKNTSFGFWFGKDVSGGYIHFEGYSSRKIRVTNYKHFPYFAIEFLFKNHFDIYGLIPAKLAIDKNTLYEE